jgi:hypothetical protein
MTDELTSLLAQSREQPLSARITTHFLPKFDNEDTASAKRLTSRAPTGACCLVVSKKHSGHLVMAPPFYSKNGVANRFSRMGALLLREHFDAVWGDAGGAPTPRPPQWCTCVSICARACSPCGGAKTRHFPFCAPTRAREWLATAAQARSLLRGGLTHRCTCAIASSAWSPRCWATTARRRTART